MKTEKNTKTLLLLSPIHKKMKAISLIQVEWKNPTNQQSVEQEIELLKIQKKTQYKKFSQVTLIDLVGDSDEENTPQKNKHYTVSDSASLSSSNDVDPMCSGSQQELFYEAMETSGIHKTEDEEMEDFYVDENKESSSREAHLLDQVILARGLRSNVERTGSMKGIGLRHTYMRKRKPGFSKAKSEKTTDDNLIDLS
ncbi:hypothetical protein BDF14DRAFT_153516 [Spinellus fusiger]|nr:hypothetical protein BDF14DRAFT_153516 [Spinellus fusiger]